MSEPLAPDDPDNPFSTANRLIFVSDKGWHQSGVGHNTKPFDFVRDGGRWEAHWGVGDRDEELDPEQAELKRDVMEDFSDGYAIALNDGQLVGGGWVSSIDYIQYEGEEQDIFSIGVEDSTIHNAEVPQQ